MITKQHSLYLTMAYLASTMGLAGLSAQPTDEPQIPASLTPQQVSGGWIGLLDGESLFGWTSAAPQQWAVDPTTHCIHNRAATALEMLRTTSQFDDFELEFDLKAAPDSVGRIFLRTSPAPKNLTADCYAIQLTTKAADWPLASLVDRSRSKQTTGLRANQWQSLKISAIGPKISVSINGQLAMSYSDRRPLGRGYLGLRVQQGRFDFKNIRLRPRKQKSLINGRDLTGWNTTKKQSSEFKVTDSGDLLVTGGSGQLESDDQFGDFILSFQCRTNAAGLNSGVFFRCIPGDLMNGYECQIQNGFQNNDRHQPADCGTGGIFRRADARYVNADDNDWFTTTVITTGPRISVWVNGLQVTDWVDRRSPNANPRRGYRQHAGTLAIQGHDPSTDIMFRNIQAKELTRRR